MELPAAWKRDTDEWKRDEEKRKSSPSSFFYSQGQALVLASDYFTDDRLQTGSRKGVASKHRHRIRLALYGQLLATFEFMLKDFIAQVVDQTDLYDEALKKAKWLEINTERVLASRLVATTGGAVLLHPTRGWHQPATVNARYKALFQYEPILEDETDDLERLWILRHTVAHNAGFVTGHDAVRMGSVDLSERVVAVDADFIHRSFQLLSGIARRTAEKAGSKVVVRWLTSRPTKPDFARDRATYTALKLIATYVESRARALSPPSERDYEKDWQAAQEHAMSQADPKNGSKQTGKTPTKAPTKAKAPAKATVPVEAKTPAKAPAKGSAKAPAKATAKEKTPFKLPIKTKPPRSVPAKALGKEMDKRQTEVEQPTPAAPVTNSEAES